MPGNRCCRLYPHGGSHHRRGSIGRSRVPVAGGVSLYVAGAADLLHYRGTYLRYHHRWFLSLLPVWRCLNSLHVKKVYPAILAKRNKHGVAYWSLFIVMAIAIGICATGATFGVVMTVFSFCNTISELPNTVSPLFAYKKYPAL